MKKNHVGRRKSSDECSAGWVGGGAYSGSKVRADPVWLACHYKSHSTARDFNSFSSRPALAAAGTKNPITPRRLKTLAPLSFRARSELAPEPSRLSDINRIPPIQPADSMQDRFSVTCPRALACPHPSDLQGLHPTAAWHPLAV